MKKNTKSSGVIKSQNKKKTVTTVPPTNRHPIPQNQLVLIASDAPFHSGKTGYFQFMGGPKADTAVLSEKPLTVQGQVMIMFAVDPKHVRVVQN